jgi:hypothetical protein
MVAVPGLLTKPEVRAAGLRHSLTALYHLLFLFTVIVSMVLVKAEEGKPGWLPAPKFFPCVGKLIVFGFVFAVSQSVMFWLSVTGKVYMNVGIVRLALALSVILIAIRNLRAQSFSGAVLLFVFLGAFHGLGLARSMDDLAVRMVDLKEMAKHYYVGFEFGFVLLSGLLLLLFFALRKRRFYLPAIVRAGSLGAIVLAVAGLVGLTLNLI